MQTSIERVKEYCRPFLGIVQREIPTTRALVDRVVDGIADAMFIGSMPQTGNLTQALGERDPGVGQELESGLVGFRGQVMNRRWHRSRSVLE